MSQELSIGAHLATPRRGFVHHGIYCGDGRVIHYAGSSRALRAGPVEEVTLEQFARGRGFVVKQCVAPRYTGAAAVERARSRLGENRYRLRSNNCEHFAHWCIEGRARSPQVEAWTERLRSGLAAFGSMFGASARLGRTTPH